MVNMRNKFVEYKDLIAFHPDQYVERNQNLNKL